MRLRLRARLIFAETTDVGCQEKGKTNMMHTCAEASRGRARVKRRPDRIFVVEQRLVDEEVI